MANLLQTTTAALQRYRATSTNDDSVAESFMVAIESFCIESDCCRQTAVQDTSGMVRGCGLSAKVAIVTFPGRPRAGGTNVHGTVVVHRTRCSNFTSGARRIEGRAGHDPRILDRPAVELGVVAHGEKGDRPAHGANLHARAC